MIGLGLSIPQVAVRAGDVIVREALRILASYGTDAHAYLPGIGHINGLAAGNWLESTGNTVSTVDGLVGLALDANGSVGSELANQTKIGEVIPTSGTSSQGVPVVLGKTYRIHITAGLRHSGPSGWQIQPIGGMAYYWVANASGDMTLYNNTANPITLDQYSVKEVTGIHATQATTANKPFLRKGAVNLLTYSQEFDNAAWVKLRTQITVNQYTAPDGTLTADKLETLTGTTAGEQACRVAFPTITPVTYSVYVKKDNWRYITIRSNNYSIFDFDTGLFTLTGAGETVTVQALANGWYRLSASTSTTGTLNIATGLALNATTVSWVTPVNGTCAAIWGAQLELGSTASTYIATTTAPKSNQVGNYAWENAATDSLVLGSVPFQMSDDHCVIAAIRPDSIAAGSKVIHSIYGAGTQKVAQLSIETATLTATWTDDSGTAGTSPTGVTVTAGTPLVACARKVGNTKELFRNDVLVNASTTAAGTTTVTTAAIGGTGATNNFIGFEYIVIGIKGTVTDADKTILSKFAGSMAGVTI